MSDTEDQEPTAWEDINPSARRELSVPAEPSSALEARLSSITDLIPVSRAEFYIEVAPCLTLAAGVGMSETDQRAWLEAAFLALKDVPIGLLRRGAQAALRSADHPSKIVPAIIEEIGETWQWRKEFTRSAGRPEIPGTPPPRSICALLDARGRPMSEEETERLNEHLGSLGSPVRYRADGSKYRLETVA